MNRLLGSEPTKGGLLLEALFRQTEDLKTLLLETLLPQTQVLDTTGPEPTNAETTNAETMGQETMGPGTTDPETTELDLMGESPLVRKLNGKRSTYTTKFA